VLVPRDAGTAVLRLSRLAPPPAPDGGDGSGAKATGGAQRTLAFVAFGVGGAGLAAGAITGAIALGKKNDLHAACPNYPGCPEQNATRAGDLSSSASTFATVSTVSFIAGGVFVAAGAVLLLLQPKRAASPLARVGASGVSVAW
jgi:hypothetical protein